MDGKVIEVSVSYVFLAILNVGCVGILDMAIGDACLCCQDVCFQVLSQHFEVCSDCKHRTIKDDAEHLSRVTVFAYPSAAELKF